MFVKVKFRRGGTPVDIDFAHGETYEQVVTKAAAQLKLPSDWLSSTYPSQGIIEKEKSWSDLVDTRWPIPRLVIFQRKRMK